MLECHHLEVGYGDLQALWGVSLRVEEGEVVALIGPNGAGKTTIMRTIVGLLRPWAGTVNLAGAELSRMHPHQVVEQGVALVPEGRKLFAGMTVLENLELGAFTARARAERADTLRQVYEIFPPLLGKQHQLAGTLSGGQQQMVAIGRALMSRPRLLLLDEPSLGLAPLVVEMIFDVVKSINQQGVTVLVVEQNAAMALEAADRAYVIENGRVVGEGAGRELLEDQDIRVAYLGVAPAGEGGS